MLIPGPYVMEEVHEDAFVDTFDYDIHENTFQEDHGNSGNECDVLVAGTEGVRPLSSDGVQSIFDALDKASGDQDSTTQEEEPLLRKSSVPAPKPGETLAHEFPPPETATPSAPSLDMAGSQDDSDLSVVRSYPQSSASLDLSHASVTFSHPMVAVTTLDELDNAPIPCHVEVDGDGGDYFRSHGTWRWVGTQMVKWEPHGGVRLPMSSQFRLTVPADVKDIRGKTLKEPYTNEFSTRPVTVKTAYPQGNSGRNPFILLRFDQRVHPKKIVRFMRLQVPNIMPVELDCVEDVDELLEREAQIETESIDIDENDFKASWKKAVEERSKARMNQVPSSLCRMIRQARHEDQKTLPKGADSAVVGQSYVVARIKDSKVARKTLGDDLLLPPASRISILLDKGASSAEGALTTKNPQTFDFQTYPALEVVPHNAESFDLAPYDSFRFKFHNPVDAPLLRSLTSQQWKDLLKITPEVDFEVDVNEYNLSIHPDSKGNTTYQVHLGGWVVDQYGQSLRNMDFEESISFPFVVKAARQFMMPHSQGMYVVDPHTHPDPTFDVTTVNYRRLKVYLYRVQPSDFENSFWHNYSRAEPNCGPHASIGRVGSLAVEKTIEVESYEDDKAICTRIPVREALPEGKSWGHVAIVVDVDKEDFHETHYNRWESRARPSAWMQITDIGADVFHSQEQGKAFAYVTSLRSGLPLSGAQLQWRDATATSDRSGMAAVAQSSTFEGNTATGVLYVTWEDQSFFLPHIRQMNVPNTCDARFYVIDDRNLYKPGETVHFKGYLRLFYYDLKSHSMKLATIPEKYCKGSTPSSAAFYVNYTVRDSRRATVCKGSMTIDARTGGFDDSFTLKDDVNLGNGSIEFQLLGEGKTRLKDLFPHVDETTGKLRMGSHTHHHTFRVEEFRRPEYSVSVSRIDTQADNTLRHACMGEDTPSIIECDAQYYAGGSLNGAQVEWRVTGRASSYKPPGVPHDFHFGVGNIRPICRFFMSDVSSSIKVATKNLGIEEDEELRTGPNGTHQLAVDCGASSLKEPRPVTLDCEATVLDINRQSFTGTTSILVHPSTLYVGIKHSSYYANLSNDESHSEYCEFLVVDIDGNGVNDVSLEVRIKQQERVIHEQTLVVKEAGEPIRVPLCASNLSNLDALTNGSVSIEASVKDSQQRVNKSAVGMYISVPNSSGVTSGRLDYNTVPRSERCNSDQLVVVPNQSDFAVGDRARMMISSPWSGAGRVRSGVWSLWNQRSMFHCEQFEWTEGGPSVEIEFEILDSFVGNGAVVFDVRIFGQAGVPEGTKGTTRVAWAEQQVPLNVSLATRTLHPVIECEQSVRPGAETTVRVSVKGPDGQYVPGCGLCVFAVDESVLALAGYSVPDPMDSFYHTNERSGSVMPQVTPSRTQVYLVKDHLDLKGQLKVPAQARPMMMRCLMSAPGGGGRGGSMMRSRSAVPEKSRKSKEKGSASPRAMMQRMSCVAECDDDMMLEGASFSEGGEPEAEVGVLSVRTNFDALAVWRPNGFTPDFTPSDSLSEKDAQVSFTFTMPDSLTRYRICCLAVHNGTQFGQTEESMSAALPIQIQPSPPRFLNFGDEAMISLVVRNQSSEAVKGASVALRSLNNLVEVEPECQGIRVDIGPRDRVEVRFRVFANTTAGTARFQSVVIKDKDTSDAAQFSFPVWAPATTEAFATYGEVDDDGGLALQRVKAPMRDDIWPQFGSLQISVSSTIMQCMQDAFIYVYRYPFDCAEQRASRILSIVSMRDVVEAFNTSARDEMGRRPPTRQEMDESIQTDLAALERIQSSNGGFSFWSGCEVNPWVSVHVALALARAMQAGVDVKRQMLERSLQFCSLSQVRQHLGRQYDGAKMDEGLHLSILSKALSVQLHLLDALDQQPTATLSKDAGELFAIWNKQCEKSLSSTLIEVTAYLLPVMSRLNQTAEVQKLQNRLYSCVQETAETACVASSSSTRQAGFFTLQSARRVDALALQAIISTDPKSTLCTKLIKGLFAHQVKGVWKSTQENASVLMAIERYFRAFEIQAPDFTARGWVGEIFCLEAEFKGRSVDTHTVNVPMKTLMEETQFTEPVACVVQKTGAPGRLYYRLGMVYAPRDLELASLQAGFDVTRRYSWVDRKGDVEYDASQRTYRVRAGARVRVSLTMSNQSTRHHVALVDPLPAAFEALNPVLQGTGKLPDKKTKKESKGFWWWGPWYEHQNFRDERVEAFCTLLSSGVHEYAYFARCTQIGEFVVPPAKAEEMYSPEIFGRSATDKVIVVEQ